MENLRRLFANNRSLVAQITSDDPEFFERRAENQEPHFLFIGCADSRVPLETLTGAMPGEMFVHRNIANQVAARRPQRAVGAAVRRRGPRRRARVVCGHYECGGVQGGDGRRPPRAGGPLAGGHPRHRCAATAAELELLRPRTGRASRLVELNVLRQVFNLSRTPIVQNAWKRGRRPMLHGVVYDLQDGLLASS